MRLSFWRTLVAWGVTVGATALLGIVDGPALAQGAGPLPPRMAGTGAASGAPLAVPAPAGGASSPASGSTTGAVVNQGTGRIGSAEVAIVGGNIASARERALAEALKQAIDQALGSLVPEARSAQPKITAQVLGRARAYVRRYRTLEEGEKGRGLYGVRIEAEIDEGALQRAFDRPTSGGVAGGGPSPTAGPSYLLAGAGAPEAMAIVARVFAASGARVQAADADLIEPAKAVPAAARAGLGAVAFVSATATADGKVRGPGVETITCAVAVRVLSAGTGLPLADESETVRSFGTDIDKTRADCFERAATAAIPRVVPAAAGRSASDPRIIVLDADVIEPGAVPALVRHVRGIGSVSAVEVRRIVAGRAELWVRSRLGGAALAATLGRDAAGALAVSVTRVTGDLVSIQVRVRDLTPTSAGPPGQMPPSPSSGAPPTSPPRPTP